MDELEMLAREPNSVITDQLFTLVCLLAHSSWEVILDTEEALKPVEERNPRRKGSPTTDNPKRFQNYATLGQEVLDNYADKELGAYVLSYFYKNEDTGKPDWPPSVRKRFNTLKEKCRRELNTWMTKGGKSLFTSKDVQKSSSFTKTMIFVGYKMDEIKEQAQSMANTHINKHWPYEFKSGQSPSGLLYIIRKHYWCDFEAPRRVTNSFKSWLSAEKKRRLEKLMVSDVNSEEDSDFEETEEPSHLPGVDISQASSICFISFVLNII